jgi:hypothetical protein
MDLKINYMLKKIGNLLFNISGLITLFYSTYNYYVNNNDISNLILFYLIYWLLNLIDSKIFQY